jgi:hypothetical protein
MKYKISIFISLILSLSLSAQVDYNGTTTNGTYSSAIGKNNDANGDYSFAGGQSSKADNMYSFAFGNTAISQGNHAIAFGTGTTSLGETSLCLGNFLKAETLNSFVIGAGLTPTYRINNTIQNSLMIGFNSNVSTFFVGEGGGLNGTGSINFTGTLYQDDMPFTEGKWTSLPGSRISYYGNVAIGVPSAAVYPLSVAGDVLFKGQLTADDVEVKEIGAWKDEVFTPEYKLLSITETETFIKENGHLPDLPSEAEVLENGYKLSEMDALLLQKIEELTLYVIEQQKEIDKLKTD